MKNFKDLSWKLKQELGEKGIEVSNAQLLDCLSKALSFKSYEEVKASPEKKIKDKIELYKVDYPLNDGVYAKVEGEGKLFDIEISAKAEIKASIGVYAKDAKEAHAKAMEFLDKEEQKYEHGELWELYTTDYKSEYVSQIYRHVDGHSYHVDAESEYSGLELENFPNDKKILELGIKDHVLNLQVAIKGWEAGIGWRFYSQLGDLQGVIVGLKNSTIGEIQFIKETIKMPIYDFLYDMYDIESRDKDSWKEGLDFIKSLN